MLDRPINLDDVRHAHENFKRSGCLVCHLAYRWSLAAAIDHPASYLASVLGTSKAYMSRLLAAGQVIHEANTLRPTPDLHALSEGALRPIAALPPGHRSEVLQKMAINDMGIITPQQVLKAVEPYQKTRVPVNPFDGLIEELKRLYKHVDDLGGYGPIQQLILKATAMVRDFRNQKGRKDGG